jgi:hypothetical protein
MRFVVEQKGDVEMAMFAEQGEEIDGFFGLGVEIGDTKVYFLINFGIISRFWVAASWGLIFSNPRLRGN